jgi:TatD DNase family protein
MGKAWEKEMAMIVDTHVHLQDPRYQDDLSRVLARAAEAGVTKAIVPGTTVEDSLEAVRLAEAHAQSPCALYATVGVQPTNAHLLTASALATLRELAGSPRVVAIGEIGLDYYWPRIENRGWHCADPAEQREAFDRQLALAAELDLPVVIHDREAHDDTLNALRAWTEVHPSARGTLHAYAGGVQHLAAVLELGFCIGMDGPVTFRTASELHAVARQVPLERLLLETDGPYLTPVPHRGQRNEPAYLVHVVAQIADLRALSLDEVAQATTTNAARLFGF